MSFLRFGAKELNSRGRGPMPPARVDPAPLYLIIVPKLKTPERRAGVHFADICGTLGDGEEKAPGAN